MCACPVSSSSDLDGGVDLCILGAGHLFALPQAISVQDIRCRRANLAWCFKPPGKSSLLILSYKLTAAMESTQVSNRESVYPTAWECWHTAALEHAVALPSHANSVCNG